MKSRLPAILLCLAFLASAPFLLLSMMNQDLGEENNDDSVSSRSCILLECPSSPVGVLQCTYHTECKNKAEFSATSTTSCSCINVLPSGCEAVNASTATNVNGVLSICEANKGNWVLPSPQVANEGRHVVTVVVDRFFEKGMYKLDGIKLSRLFINARFKPAADKPCTQVHGVEMFTYTNGLCLLRSRVTMPGVEHTTDDHYYYDDKTPLETSLSRDYFFGATTAEVWLDMSKEKIVRLPGTNSTSVRFKSLLKSGIIEHKLPALTPPSATRFMTTSKPARR